MAANDGNHPVRDLFGVALPGGTGAMGSAGAPAPQADDTWQVPVVGPYDTSQGTLNRVGVGRDDTARPGQLREGISGADVSATGSGQGSVSGPPHPNAAEVPSLAVQAQAARSPR